MKSVEDVSLKGVITLEKTFLLPQFICVESVLDPSKSTYEKINE